MGGGTGGDGKGDGKGGGGEGGAAAALLRAVFGPTGSGLDSTEDLDRLRLAFRHYDADKSGALGRGEFRSAMLDSGMHPHPFECDALFTEADLDHSAAVSFDEFVRLVLRYRARQGPLERLVERATDLVLPRPPYIRRGLARLVKPLQAYPAASYVAHRRQETGYAGAIWEGWAEARDEGGNRYYD